MLEAGVHRNNREDRRGGPEGQSGRDLLDESLGAGKFYPLYRHWNWQYRQSHQRNKYSRNRGGDGIDHRRG